MSLNCRSPLSIESILSTMSNSGFASFSKDTDEGVDDFNNNSFLMKSGKFTDDSSCNSTKEDVADEDSESVKQEEKETEESHNPELESHKDIEVNSINMEDNLEASELNSIGQYSCHLCSFVCIKKNDFHEHLLTHYTYSCNQCDYASRTEGRLKRHVKDFHSSNSPENFSGQKVASNNPKSLKCKHCGIISSTKEKHWSHQRTHLDVSKCLQCPKCPFITEYKHHLEYHIRNHEKIKPYKCSKCQYRCVNKSMLNSHKKSHSNVYQFRCADCSYASKYCHSLKQHLNRHGHQPAPVLNEDGSLPTYDNSNEILSMKRGPNNRNVTCQNTLSGLTDGTPAFSMTPHIQGHPIRPDLPIVPSAFTTFKKDQMNSILNWTLKQCCQAPISRFMPSQFPLMPPIPSLMSLSALPPAPRDSSQFSNIYQSSALDLSVKTTSSNGELERQRPQTMECSICRMQFCDKKLFDMHLLFHGRYSNFRCTKCGTAYHNVLDFFTHVTQSCRE